MGDKAIRNNIVSFDESSDDDISVDFNFHDDNRSCNSDNSVFSAVDAANLLQSGLNTTSSPNSDNSDDDDESTIQDKDTTKTHTKPNESMTSQAMLSCIGQFKNVISLIENFHDKNKVSKVWNNPKKKANKNKIINKRDLQIALDALKKIEKEMNVASSEQFNTYRKICNKRKAVEDRDEYVMTHGCSSSSQYKDQSEYDIALKRQSCSEFIKGNSSIPSILSSRKSKRLKSTPKSQLEIKRDSRYIIIPRPRVGGTYFPTEMADILTNQVDSPDMFFVLRKLIKLKMIPCNERMALRHVANYKNGKTLPLMFRRPGRKRIILPSDMKKLREELLKNGGEGIGYEQTRKIVQEYADKKAISEGKLPSYNGGKPVSEYAVRIYHEDLALNKLIGIRRSVKAKPKSRIAAENSLRSVASYLFTVAATHFISGTSPKDHPCRVNKGSSGARALSKAIKKACGKDSHFYPIHRSLLSSTDDTTLFICPKKIESKRKKDQVLVSQEFDGKTQNYYKEAQSATNESSRGMRVKLTFTFFGNGTMAPVYVTASGFTERDIPKDTCPDGIKVIPIPGLCAARNRDATCQSPGYLILLRNDVSLDSVHLRNHAHYHKNIYRPAVQKARKDYFGHDHTACDEVPDHLTSVGWMDGDIQHIKAIVRDEIRDQCINDKNIKCKQSACRTGVEQPCDVCIIFKLLKSLERELTLNDILNDTLSGPLDEMFKSYSRRKELNLPPHKLRTLKDFLARLPYMLDKTCTVDNILDGFVSTGMLDPKHKLWPDIDQVLRTKRQNITASEKDLIMSNFSRLYHITMKEGHISDQIYDELGFPSDCVGSNVLERDHSIALEWMQRAKWLTHEFQHQLRVQREERMQLEFLEKLQKEREEIEDIIRNNGIAESKILDQIKDNNLKHETNPDQYEKMSESVEHASLYMFFTLGVPELKAFIHVRTSSTKDIDKSIFSRYPRKGSFEDSLKAIRDNSGDTLVTLAFKQRTKSIILT